MLSLDQILCTLFGLFHANTSFLSTSGIAEVVLCLFHVPTISKSHLLMINYKIIVLTVGLIHFGKYLRRDLWLDSALRQLICIIVLLNGVVEHLLWVSALETCVVVLDVDNVISLNVLSLLFRRLLARILVNHLNNRRLWSLGLPLVFKLVIKFGFFCWAALFWEILKGTLTIRVFQFIIILGWRMTLDQHTIFLVLLLRLIWRHGWIRVDFA